MLRTLLRLALRLALGAAISWSAWRIAGLAVMVGTLPIFGALLAKPLLDLASDLKLAMRTAVWAGEQRRYYAYRDRQVHVVEDADHVRWLPIAEVRAIVGFTASDGVRARTYPDGWRHVGTPAVPHLSAEALLVHLRKERSDRAGHFARWVERDVAYPARRLRGERDVVSGSPATPEE